MNKYKYSFDLGAFFGSEEKETRLKEAPEVETSILPRPKQKQEAVQEAKPEYDPYGFIPDFAAAYEGAGGVPTVGSDLPMTMRTVTDYTSAVDNVLNKMQTELSPQPDLTAATPVATPEVTYDVVGGDNLTKIARKYDVSVDDIVEANGLADADALSIGQSLVIPSASQVDTPEAAATEEPAPVTAEAETTGGLMSPRLDSKGETPKTTSIPDIKFLRNKGTTQGDVERSVYEYAYEQGLRDDELKAFMSQVAHESALFSTKAELGRSKSNVNNLSKARYSVGDTYKKKKLSAGDPMVGQFKDINRRRMVRDGVTDAQGNLQNYSVDNVFNSIYASRNGNGDFASGDGSRYKGRGYIQLTGRNNYRAVGEAIGVDLEGNPDLMLDPDIAKKASVAWWKLNVQPRKPDYTDVTRITLIVNGGDNGLDDRRKKFEEYGKPVTAVSKSVRPKMRPEKTEE